MKILFVLENSADPGEMQHNAAFHLGLHCLPKGPFAKRLNWWRLSKTLSINTLYYIECYSFIT